MVEVWNRFHIIIDVGSQRLTIKIEQYESNGQYPRKFTRVYGPDYDYKKEAHSQIFGFGPTIELALARFLFALERRLLGRAPEGKTLHPPPKLLKQYGFRS